MRKRGTLSILWMLVVMAASAQTDTLHIPSMQEAYRQNSWLSGNNPVGLSFNRFRSFSVAEAGYGYQKGNFGNVSIPSSTHTYTVYSESFQTIGKVAVYGKLGYTQKQKHDINWNGMAGNYWQGINLCDSISGNQSSEQYQLQSAFSLPIHSRWLIGTRFDYQAELTAKDTDPRDKNQWMEWKLTPGIGYQFNKFRLGTSLFYVNRKEKVDYQNIGTHVTYPFLVTYPLGFYKTLPRSGSINWHYTANEFGGGMQMEYLQNSIRLFQQLSGSSTSQSIVSNQITNRKEGESDCWNIHYQGKLQRFSFHNHHEWNWLAVYYSSNNYEPLQQQEESGLWNSYGKVLRSTYRSNTYAFSYGFHQLRDSWHPRFSWITGVDFHQIKNDLLFYPVKYSQNMHRFTIHTQLTRNFLMKNATLDCTLGGKYEKGGGDRMEEKQLQDNSTAPDIKLWQNQNRLLQEFNYQTDPRWLIHASITYTRTIPFSWFVRITGEFEKAGINMPNKNKQYFSTQIGLLF